MRQFLLTLFTLSISTLIYCQQGFIDNSFGNDGFDAGKMPGLVNSIVQQPDGKLLAAGSYFDFNATIIRLLPNGDLDSSFGNNGGALTKGGAYKMLLLKDGRILVVGEFVDENDDTQSFLAQLTAGGKPDSSFGINGTSIIPKFHFFESYTEIALTADGSIITGGFGANNPNTLDSQYTVISRFSADGKFDNNFGNNGHVVNLAAIVMNDLAMQSDGKIVTAGYSIFSKDYVLSRYNMDGTLDNSFGTNGNVVTAGKGEDNPEKIIIGQDGKLIVGGYSKGNKYYMAALRYNNDGSLDNSFGDAGQVYIDFGDSAGLAYDMLQQPDGKFILAGAVSDLGQNGRNFGLCRITNDGRLDSSFGINGLQITSYPGGGEAYCATLQTDAKIVLGGYYQGDEGQSYLMVRYNNGINQKQILITKIRHWILHHNGIEWDYNNNISSYVVQRSYDGIHFSSIARINSSNSSNLTYQDQSPLNGTNYYRLQTTSLNGVTNYSNVIAVTNSDIKISPNPATNSLHIEGLSNQKVQLSVVDFSGDVKLQTVVNSSTYNLNIASLKSGNYLLKIESQNDLVTKAFVKE